MSFRLDDVIIDRIQMAVATDFNDNPLYTLTQLNDASISVSAESTDAVDRDGTLIKRFWRGKTGTFTAENASATCSQLKRLGLSLSYVARLGN